MYKITITEKIKENFKSNVLGIFKNNKLVKKKNKKEIFNISKNDIDILLKKKLKKFDIDISLEKLILADLDYIYKIKNYIDNNKYITKLTKKEKDYFYTLYERLKKSEFIQDLGIKVCPYCNRNYISNFNKSNSKNATAQLDHFFDKSTYPYLSISLYNLIPSCSTCNQRKSSKNIELLHPYQNSLDEFIRFELNIQDVEFYYKQNGFKITLIANSKIAQNNIDIFNLEYLYNNHKDIVLEIIKRNIIYNDSYLDELIQKYEGTLFNSKDELIGLVHCNHIDKQDINKRPLSKLTKDIWKQIDG